MIYTQTNPAQAVNQLVSEYNNLYTRCNAYLQELKFNALVARSQNAAKKESFLDKIYKDYMKKLRTQSTAATNAIVKARQSGDIKPLQTALRAMLEEYNRVVQKASGVMITR